MPAGSRYSTRLLTRPDELDAVADDWDRLWASAAHARVNQRLDALRRDHPDRDGESAVWAVVLECDNQIVGVAPLILIARDVRWKLRLARTYRTMLRFSMTGAEFCGESLMAPEDPAAHEVLIDGLLDACRDFDVVRFPYVRADADPRVSLTTRRAGRWAWVAEGGTPVLTLRLASDFATYMHELPRKRRQNFSREHRTLAEADGGPLRLLRITEPGQVAEFLDLAQRVFRDSWHVQRGANPIFRGEQTVEQFVWLAEHGWLRCYVLCKGDEPLAFLTGQQNGRVLRLLRTAYAAGWARYSPGKVMWYMALEDLHCSDELDELSLGYGDWEYKRVLATGRYTVDTLELIRPSIRTAVAWSGPVAYRRVRTAGIGALRRLNFDERVAAWSRKRLAR